ncbi:MAG: polysaccharide deacetylase family protein [Clostridia bacterium]|nr:polysaccharide deacetylase family protein [Clostridia bacterium]
MRIKLYIKNHLKTKIIFFAALIILISSAFLSNFYFWATAPKQNLNPGERKLPVLMYHMISKNPTKENKFIISEKTFEEDLKYIKSHGFTAILIADLVAFSKGEKDLPEKPILLTFDDGAYNNFLYAFPLAQKYGAKFVFSPIAKESEKYSKIKDENPIYAHANWEAISKMAKSGLVEIQNHTYNMHSCHKPRIGCKKQHGESLQDYEIKLTEDLNKAQDLIEKNTGIRPTAFFYPFGAKSECSEKIIKSLGFKATFMCESRVNIIKKGNSECLLELGRFLRPQNVPSEIFFKKLNG